MTKNQIDAIVYLLGSMRYPCTAVCTDYDPGAGGDYDIRPSANVWVAFLAIAPDIVEDDFYVMIGGQSSVHNTQCTLRDCGKKKVRIALEAGL